MFLTFFLADVLPDITESSRLKRLGNGIVVAVSYRDFSTGTAARVDAATGEEATHAAVAFGQSKRGGEDLLS